jgi:hypothetical protein
MSRRVCEVETELITRANTNAKRCLLSILYSAIKKIAAVGNLDILESDYNLLGYSRCIPVSKDPVRGPELRIKKLDKKRRVDRNVSYRCKAGSLERGLFAYH